MAAYDEVSHTVTEVNTELLDPLYRWDTHFPERITRMNAHLDVPDSPARRRHKQRMRNRGANRYKTQPVTFEEIKEVDEVSPQAPHSKERGDGDVAGDLKTQFAAFSRSMEGLLPGTAEANATDDLQSGGSSKENLSTDIKIELTGSPSDPSVKLNLPTGLSKHEAYRARRKSRRTRKSIEEEPELELLETTTTKLTQTRQSQNYV